MQDDQRMTTLQDHDSLIRLGERVGEFEKDTGQLIEDLRKNTEKRMTEEGQRVDEIDMEEKTIGRQFGEANIPEMAKQVQADAEWIKLFKAELKTLYIVLIFVWPLFVTLLGIAIAKGFNPLVFFKLIK